MKRCKLICAVIVLMAWTSQVEAFTLTFDDIPQGPAAHQYLEQYGVSFSSLGFSAVDHTGSVWGLPHSGNNVLVWTFDNTAYSSDIYLPAKNLPLSSTVGAYFSTEPGVVLEMTAYGRTMWDPPVASAIIGDTEQSWNNVYISLNDAQGMRAIEFREITPGSLLHFCIDDLTITPVPEPSSIIALGAGLVPLGFALRRRRNKG